MEFPSGNFLINRWIKITNNPGRENFLVNSSIRADIDPSGKFYDAKFTHPP